MTFGMVLVAFPLDQTLPCAAATSDNVFMGDKEKRPEFPFHNYEESTGTKLVAMSFIVPVSSYLIGNSERGQCISSSQTGTISMKTRISVG